jgi:hypothetical protein
VVLKGRRCGVYELRAAPATPPNDDEKIADARRASRAAGNGGRWHGSESAKARGARHRFYENGFRISG